MEQRNDTDNAFTDFGKAAAAIFGSEAKEVALPSLGRTVHIKQATMKQIPHIVAFFRDTVLGMNHEALGALVDMVADKQVAAIKAGKDPRALPVDEITGISVVTQTFGKINLVADLLNAVITSLPRVAAMLSDLTEDEFENLPADEGMLIAGGVFMVNYGFFTRSLPPIFTAFMQGLSARKKPAAESHALGGAKKEMT